MKIKIDLKKWHKLDSSNIDAIRYAKKEKVLQVKFLSGTVYEYKDVPQEKFEEFLAAPSAGKYLNFWIKDIYDCDLMEEGSV